MTAKNKYTFKVAGKDYSIPAFKDLPMGVIRKARKGADDADKVFIIIEETLGLDSKELAAIDKMSQEEFGEFLTEWTQGAGLPEA